MNEVVALHDFVAALTKSSELFEKLLKKELIKVLGGEFEVVEGVTVDWFKKQLDMISGIDVWHIDDAKGIRGIASRIQSDGVNWHTFTVRKSRDNGSKTEYEKKCKAIESGYLYPYLTTQAYATKDDVLLSFAIARTKDIFKMISGGYYKTQHTKKDQIGQAGFYAVDWYEMKDFGFGIFIKEFK